MKSKMPMVPATAVPTVVSNRRKRKADRLREIEKALRGLSRRKQRKRLAKFIYMAEQTLDEAERRRHKKAIKRRRKCLH